MCRNAAFVCIICVWECLSTDLCHTLKRIFFSKTVVPHLLNAYFSRKQLFPHPGTLVFFKNACSRTPERLFFSKMVVPAPGNACFSQKWLFPHPGTLVFLKNSCSCTREHCPAFSKKTICRAEQGSVLPSKLFVVSKNDFMPVLTGIRA